MDPGTANFGFTIVEYGVKTYKILEIGQIEATVKNLTNDIAYKRITKAQRAKAKTKGKRLLRKEQPSTPPFLEGLARFDEMATKLLADANPDVLIIERFQARGLKGSTIEAVSMMVGVLALLTYRNGREVYLTTAAGWKNEVNKITSLEDFYEVGKHYGYSAHEMDAYFMGMYVAAKKLGTLEQWILQAQENLKKFSKSITADTPG